MEQKRILWIVAAVGIFLLVIIGSTLILYAPQDNSDPVMAFTQSQNDTWVNPTTIKLSNDLLSTTTADQNKAGSQELTTSIPSEITADPTVVGTPSSSLTATTLQANDLTVFSNTTTVYSADGLTTIDLAANDQKKPTQSETVIKNVSTRLPSESPAPVQVASVAAPKAASPAALKAASSTAPKATSTVLSTPIVKLVPAKKTVAALVVPKAPANQYWVQAASFISKTNAEEARSALSREKIPSEVFTHADASGITYYRVRVGPYTTKSEAEYWNSLIKLIDQFGSTQSYVTNSTMPYSG